MSKSNYYSPQPPRRQRYSQPLPPVKDPIPQPVTSSGKTKDIYEPVHPRVKKTNSQPLPAPAITSPRLLLPAPASPRLPQRFFHQPADDDSSADHHEPVPIVQSSSGMLLQVSDQYTTVKYNYVSPVPWRCSYCKVEYGKDIIGCSFCGEPAPFIDTQGINIVKVQLQRKPLNRKSM